MPQVPNTHQVFHCLFNEELQVWFPASWGPSVVEAIQTRSVTCLAKKPIVRDPHIFDQKEAARGSRAREVTCRIQKWNIKAEGFHPILVVNARVDWLAMDDDDIETMLWDISVIPNGTGQEIPYASSGSSTYECVGPLPTSMADQRRYIPYQEASPA